MTYQDELFSRMQRAYDQMEPPEGYYGEDEGDDIEDEEELTTTIFTEKSNEKN